MKYKKFIIFILITFLISWISWGVLIIKNQEIFLLRILGSYGSLVALIFVLIKFKDDSLKKSLFHMLKMWRINIKWYFFSILITLVVGILAILLNNLFFEKVFFDDISPLYVLIAIPYVLLTSVLGEETGWRGYALNFINKEIGDIKGSFLIGILWALWHLPLFLLSTDFHKSIPFVLFLTQCILMTYIYSWIYKNTKSLITQHIFHTFSNITVGLLPLIPAMNGNNLKPLSISIALLGIFVVIIYLPRKFSNPTLPSTIK